VAAVHVEDATGDARRLGAPEPHDKRSDVVGVVAVELFGLALRCVLAETEVLGHPGERSRRDGVDVMP